MTSQTSRDAPTRTSTTSSRSLRTSRQTRSGADFGITEPEQRPVIPQQAPEPAPQVYEGERFDFLFVCHTAEEQEWLAQMLGGTLRKVYEAQEVIDAQG